MNALTTFSWMILLPLVASPFIYIIGRITVRRRPRVRVNPAGWLAGLVLLATGIFLYFTTSAYQAQSAGDHMTLTIGAVGLNLDGISLLLAAVVITLSLLVTIFSIVYMRGEAGEEKFYAMLVAMTGTIIGLGCAADLFNLWVWFECMAITSYLLVAFYRNEKPALEAGFKYLVQSAVGSVLVLLGISIVFGQTGSLDMSAIPALLQSSKPILLAAAAMIIIGFGVKAALVPMHTWLPDAHSQAPSGISAMLSGIVIEAGLIAMLRALGGLTNVSHVWGAVLMGFGAINIVLGNLMALRQTQVKRLLAYSSIGHVGYMLAGFGIALAFGIPEGAQGGFFHLITHALMKGLAFLAAGALLYALYLSKHKHQPLTVADLDGASRRYPLVAFTFSVAVLSLGGLPPLAGFMSKWQIFVAGFQSQNILAILLILLAAFNSVLSLGYYAPLVNRMYRREQSEAVREGSHVSWLISLPLVLLTLAVIVLGFWPTLLDCLTAPAAHTLMAAFGG
ncbi:MAG TPA: proton-conducting transporter membrane subunit [Anaerolineaceae bacterium]|nr:proton-conducting transporter membrane subunit [Anaerolineaceae bacterium]